MKLTCFVFSVLLIFPLFSICEKSKNQTLFNNRRIPGGNHTEKDELYSVKIRGIKCSNIDPVAFTNVTCRLRAVRGHQGVLDVAFTYNNIPRLSTTYQLFYRNSNGRYMNYFVDITVDYCKINSGNLDVQSFAIKLFLNLFNKYDTAIMNGCPLNGKGNYMNFEIDKVKQNVLPNIVPAGDFIFYAKMFDTASKKKLFDIELNAQVKSTNPMMQLSMLNMG